MKINKINTFNTPKNITKKVNNTFNTNPINFNKSTNDAFIKNNPVSFAGHDYDIMKIDWYWDYAGYTYKRYPENVDIYCSNEDHIIKVAKSLCMYKDSDIMKFTEVYRRFLGFKNYSEKYSKESFDILMPYIEQERKNILDYSNTVRTFEARKLESIIDLTKYKNLVSIKLLRAMEAKDIRGIDANIPNGVLIYGNSEKYKNEMKYWIKEKSGLNNKSVTYNPENPEESIDELYKQLNEAKKVYEAIKVRTLLELKNFDQLFTNYNTPEAKRLIALFKNISEYAAKDYGTTLLLTTSKPLEEFEPASIGSQRFGIAINLSGITITQKEEEAYEIAKIKLEEYKKLARDAKDEYSYVERTDNSDDYSID